MERIDAESTRIALLSAKLAYLIEKFTRNIHTVYWIVILCKSVCQLQDNHYILQQVHRNNGGFRNITTAILVLQLMGFRSKFVLNPSNTTEVGKRERERKVGNVQCSMSSNHLFTELDECPAPLHLLVCNIIPSTLYGLWQRRSQPMVKPRAGPAVTLLLVSFI